MRKSLDEEQFLKDVAKHEMTILKDDGVYRHIRMKQPGSWNMWFEVVTWPGFLAYTGDMGAFTFTRLEDMFQFFRADREPDRLGINPDYWSEKLEAVDRNGRNGEYSQFSTAKFKEHVEDTVKEWIANCDVSYDADDEDIAASRKKFEEELREEIEEQIYLHLDDGQHELHRALNKFEFTDTRWKANQHKYQFQDTWEWDCEDYTLRFLWCCYALAYTIKMYDEFKAKQNPAS